MSLFRFALVLGLCGVVASPAAQSQSEEEAADPPEIVLGERLFLETRFAQTFKQFLDQGGHTNASLPVGDPVMDTTSTTGAPLPGPFAGQSMNCRACHLVDEHVETAGGGMRTYADFARRSPVPSRPDGAATAPRNSPALVNATLPRSAGLLLHFDGEFATTVDLVKATFGGRNFGWLPGEASQAMAHMARIVREDDGTGPLARDFGGLSYATVLTGLAPSIPDEFRIPESFRVPVATATDLELFEAVAKLVGAYTDNLVFSQDETGAFTLSPYDVFLAKNNLPRRPAQRETNLEYSRRLIRAIERLDHDHRLAWVTDRPHRVARRHRRQLRFVHRNPATDNGAFQSHDQAFRFGPEELAGLKIFFAESGAAAPKDLERRGTGVGNCIGCHHAPVFTDFRAHNTGTAQAEYDAIHGPGRFAHLAIPDLNERNGQHDAYLPATDQHPHAQGPFRSVPTPADPRRTDLGVWNVFANPDMPAPQALLGRLLCQDVLSERVSALGTPNLFPDVLSRSPHCAPQALLPKSIARFKTPGLRDLGHSAPFMHNGQFGTIENVLQFYRSTAALQRAERLRNGAPLLAGIRLGGEDIGPLAAFLRSLNEDYE